jgi:hypothetical protein
LVVFLTALESSSATAYKRGVASWTSFVRHSLIANLGKSRVFDDEFERTVATLIAVCENSACAFLLISQACCAIRVVVTPAAGYTRLISSSWGWSFYLLLVVLCFSCRLDCTHTIAWECMYLSSLIHLALICLYYTQFFSLKMCRPIFTSYSVS